MKSARRIVTEYNVIRDFQQGKAAQRTSLAYSSIKPGSSATSDRQTSWISAKRWNHECARTRLQTRTGSQHSGVHECRSRARANPGYLRVMFAVDDIDETLEALRKRGAQLVGEVVQYKDAYRLCYIRGPEGLLIGLAQELS